jgi:hypothetical protein
MADDDRRDEKMPPLGLTQRDRAVSAVRALSGAVPYIGSILSEVIGQLTPAEAYAGLPVDMMDRVRPPPASGRGWAFSGAQAWLRRTLMQDWLRSGPESPTLAPRKPKSAGRVGWCPPEGEMALLRGSVWTGPDQNDLEDGPASSRGRLCVRNCM